MGARGTLTSLLIATSLFAVVGAAAERGGSVRDRVVAVSPAGVTVPPGFSQVVVLATNSVDLEQNSAVLSGSVVVDQPSPGPTLGCGGRELCVGVRATTPAGYAVAADSIQVKSHGEIGGDAFCNDLTNHGADPGLACAPFSPPAFAFLPAFVAETPRPDAADVVVPVQGSAVLEPGDYGVIDVGQKGSVLFTGGVYNVEELDFGVQSKLEFAAPSEVRVAGRSSFDQKSYVGPAAGSGIGAADLVFYVAGINGATGALGATPKAAKIGVNATAMASFYVPFGTLEILQNAHATGAFLARDVRVGVGVEVSLASAFRNRAPTADPQTVFTGGLSPISITLTGSDPENDDLAFSIVPASGPTHGSLGPVVQDPPPFPGDPPGCNPANTDPCDPPDPPRTRATVTYAPFTGGDVEDAFGFQVEDPSGNAGTATVRVNPPGDPTTPPPPVGTVEARAAFAEAANALPAVVTLTGDAPPGVDLTFAIVPGSGPAHGTLSAVTPGSESPRRTATVTYTPTGVDFGEESFDFEACGSIDAVEVCDAATATVAVIEAQAQATPQTVETAENTAVTIALGGSPGLEEGGGGFSGLRVITGEAAFLDGAEVAGGVSDADADGAGDEVDAGGARVVAVLANETVIPSSASTNGAAVRLDAFYDGEPGVSSTVVAGEVTSLAGVDVFAAPLPDDAFSPAELAVFADFLAGGGTILFLGENQSADFATANAAINAALAGLGSTLSIVPPGAGDAGFHRATVGNGQILADPLTAGVGAFDYAAPSGVSAGTGAAAPLFLQTDLATPFVASQAVGGGRVVVAGDTNVLNPLDGSSGAPTDGDNGVFFTNLLPAAPTLTSAGVEGGVTTRIEIEWDLAGLEGSTALVEGAQVLLHTVKGAGDSLTTSFFAGAAEQDGALTPSDFEAPVAPIAGSTMPVPAGPAGTAGTHAFDVLRELREALTADEITFFSIQGRVDENQSGRGLQVRTTAAANVAADLQPQLALTTPGVTAPPVEFSVLTLPANGTLENSLGQVVSTVPATLPDNLLTYTPDAGFSGVNVFTFQVEDFTTGTFAFADVTVIVNFLPAGDCNLDPTFCDDGRP